MTGKNKEKKYISYFQSVQTIGIMTYAKNTKEAEKLANAKFKARDRDGSVIENCLYDQTLYELTNTEEWKPEIETTYTENGLGWKFYPSEKTKKAIALKISKKAEDITEEDFTTFIKDSLEASIK